jgi:hypothetical protein
MAKVLIMPEMYTFFPVKSRGDITKSGTMGSPPGTKSGDDASSEANAARKVMRVGAP